MNRKNLANIQLSFSENNARETPHLAAGFPPFTRGNTSTYQPPKLIINQNELNLVLESKNENTIINTLAISLISYYNTLRQNISNPVLQINTVPNHFENSAIIRALRTVWTKLTNDKNISQQLIVLSQIDINDIHQNSIGITSAISAFTNGSEYIYFNIDKNETLTAQEIYQFLCNEIGINYTIDPYGGHQIIEKRTQELVNLIWLTITRKL